MMRLARGQSPDKPAKRHLLRGLSTTLITMMIALALVVSAAPKASADPADPGQPDPTMSATQVAELGAPVDPIEDAPPTAAATPPDDTMPPPTINVSVGADNITFVWDPSVSKPKSASSSGSIPMTLDTTAINNASYASVLNKAGALPSKYDLRVAHPDYLTGVRDQGGWNTSWAFAASEAAEASLVRGGVLTGKESPAAKRQISPLHLVQASYYNNTFKAGTTGCSPTNAYNLGGNDLVAAATWSHWAGAQTEAAYPYPLSTSKTCNLPPKISSAGLNSSAYHLSGLYELPMPYDDNGYSPSNVAVIKNAVYTYGAVTTTFAGGMMGTYYNSAHQSFYDPNWDESDQAVVIIGWDDNFAASNFSIAPAGPGAFLIQNSRGVGNKDYFWLSYHDNSMFVSVAYDMVGLATSTYRSPYEWTKQYSYDALGAFGPYGSGTKSVTYSNKFTASSATTLRAVQIVAGDSYKYNISVYTGKIKSGSPVAGGKAQALTSSGAKSVSGKLTYAGYNTITLPKPVVLKKGQKFSIVVTLTSVTQYSAYALVEQRVDFGAGNAIPTISRGQSYMVFLNKWYDLVDAYHLARVTGWLGNATIIALTSPAPKWLLTYNANGGTVSPTSKAVAKNAKAGKLAKPTRSGYTFKGWYTKALGGKKMTSQTVVKSDRTIYAHWVRNK